jgi:hypothetical protein
MANLNARQTAIVVQTPILPPFWALLERELLRMQTLACQEFFAHYFDDRGYLLCVPRWGGDDGPDDAAENLSGWTLLHALGAPETILTLYKKGWEGHLRQYSEAKTVEVPFARDGMYYKEFPVMFDWIHNGEGLAVFLLQCLSDPYDAKLRQRMARFAGFYMGEDPQAANYDPVHKVIRSMFNGSRGPLLRKATGLDWVGDPIEIEGRFNPVHGERSYAEMVAHFQDYNDVVGDHPLNLGTTTLAFNAYMLTGDAKYKEWLLGYVDAWVERTVANNGIIPTNIGLDGTIGGACDGKWYGGVYGWGFTVFSPQLGRIVHRPYFQIRCHYGFGNALLLTGDPRYVDVWRQVIDNVNANYKDENGERLYPYSYGDEGWYNYKAEPYSQGALEVYYWSMNQDDLQRLPKTGWIGYLEGENPGYPVTALQAELAILRQKVEKMRQDTATPDTRLSDEPNLINPATLDVLTELMLGGIPTDSLGYPLHCRVRYFDPDRRRAGIPQDVAALVERMTADEVTLTLVNLNQVEPRTVVVQGGAYGEHHIQSVTLLDQTLPVENAFFTVRLEPGCGGSLLLKMRRYANAPTCVFPWDR